MVLRAVAVGFFFGGAFLYLCDVYMETQQIHDPLEFMQDAVLGRKPKAKADSPLRRSPRSSSNPYATPSNARLRRPDALPRVPSSLEGGRGPPQPDDDSTAKRPRRRGGPSRCWSSRSRCTTFPRASR